MRLSPKLHERLNLRRIMVIGQPGQKRLKTLQDLILNRKKLGMAASTCHHSYSGKLKTEESQYRPAWAKSETLSQKYPEEKRAGSMDEAVESLPHN
jgi:hypothetical protein